MNAQEHTHQSLVTHSPAHTGLRASPRGDQVSEWIRGVVLFLTLDDTHLQASITHPSDAFQNDLYRQDLNFCSVNTLLWSTLVPLALDSRATPITGPEGAVASAGVPEGSSALEDLPEQGREAPCGVKSQPH